MADILTSDAISDLELTLRRVALNGDRASTDSDMLEQALARFSNEDLIIRLEQAARFVASICQSGDVGTGSISPSWSLDDALKLVGTSPEINGVNASRRTFSDHLDKKSIGATPTDDYPIYVFEDRELLVEGDSEDPAGASVDVVKVPSRVIQTGSGDLDGSGNLTISSGISLNSKHEETVLEIDDGAGTVVETRIISVSTSTSGTVDSETTISGDITVYEPVYSSLDDKFRGPIVHLASALCNASLGQGEAMQASLQRFWSGIRPYTSQQFDLRDESQ